jgi:glycosyltransferase involved in cell wall biosynthesis
MRGWKYYYKSFGHLIENWFRKYRAYLKPSCYKIYRLHPVQLDFGSPPVSVIDLRSTEILTDAGRYFHALANGLLDAGHQVYVVKKFWLLSELTKKKFSKVLIDSGRIQFIDKKKMTDSDSEIEYLWCDFQSANESTRSAKITVHLSLSSRPVKGRLWMPYQMHPAMSGLPSDDAKSNQNTRRFGIFFIGNVEPAYDSEFVKSHHVMTRIQVIEALIDKIVNPIIYEKFDRLRVLDERDQRSLFLPKYNRFTQRSNGLIPSENYLSTLGEIDFVICTPGTYMPFAHNVIEAMSQGCIPILGYANYFSPNLTDGLNCLVFNDDTSLILAINKASEMGQEERKMMREEVLRYYDANLKFSSFLSKIDGMKNPVNAYYYG